MPADLSFEALATSLTGKDKERFLSMLSDLLCWRPEERPAASRATSAMWLRIADFEASRARRSAPWELDDHIGVIWEVQR